MDESKAMEEVAAAASSGSGSKHFVNLVRFASVLIDQTVAAKLTPDEMRFVAASYRNAVELLIAEQRNHDG